MWIAITESHLLTRLSGTELAKLRGAALASGQADPVQPAIDEVSGYVRGFVGRRYRLGDGNTIPQELLGAALAIVVVELMTRVAGVMIDPKELRKQAAIDANKLLQATADGVFAVESPVVPSSAVISNPGPRFDAPTLMFDWESEEGL